MRSTTRRLLLGSSSPYRRELLERLGLPFEWASPPYEESLDVEKDPARLVTRHARGKAESLRDQYPDALIIGSDQVVAFEGQVLGKPGSPEGARDQLAALAGREHFLVTAVVVLDAASGELGTHLEVSPMRLRELSAAEITRYVELENPVDCAGSYKSEGLGVTLFAAQGGDDPTAVVGLPLIGLCALLRRFGVNPLE